MKTILLSIFSFASSLIFSQVGVNTSNPQNIFHVDANKDNASSGTPTISQQSNDFIVNGTGNIGLGDERKGSG